MKAGCRIISLVLCLIFILSGTAIASGSSEYADKLYELGLFRGTENGYELDRALSREEAATMIVRLMGVEDEVLNAEYNENFVDVPQTRWSFPYVMYCYEHGITKGTGSDTFSPQSIITAREYTTLILRLLEYEAEPGDAYYIAVEKGMFSTSKEKEFDTSPLFLRGDMVYISYRALKTKNADGIILADILAENGVITQKQAEEFDIYNNTDMEGLLKDLFN